VLYRERVTPILDGLNPEQRRAAETLRGPVCILAGAGSGKTTTITRRIANQIATRTYAPTEILAVTFTEKAAGELRSRLRALGVAAVPARTFHAAALAQLSALAAEPPGTVLPSKALPLRQIANSLPKPFRFRPAGDLATEIEWAKNRRVAPSRYLDSLGRHEPPIPADLMARVFREYERRKSAAGRADFEDLLELAIRMYEESPQALERFRRRYHAFTVDEYQDVNLLQQTLLERWLGDRDDLCVVGDDYQSIYGFTGASPEHLLAVPLRFPHAVVVRLEENYRSTPQVLELANRLVPFLGGAEKALRPVRADGPEPSFRTFFDIEAEAAAVAATARELHEQQGVPWEEIAILYRTNARSEDFEQELAAAQVPFQVRSGAFLERPAARRVLAVLARAPGEPVRATVEAVVEREGSVGEVPAGLGEQETTRQEDFRRLLALAREFDRPERTVQDFVADLHERFRTDGSGRGVQLLTYHRAKGLEFDAVFLPRLEEKELPIRQARTPDDVAEERRLLYVGLTRAKRYLFLSKTNAVASRFLDELGLRAVRSSRAPTAQRADGRRAAAADIDRDDPVFAALRSWRLERARADGVPPYVVFHDRTLQAIAQQRPATEDELAEVSGVGATKLERYGSDVLMVLARAGAVAGPSPEPLTPLPR
jgi:DNA helicase-2/ATP-dependent DNA helicase PcrA